MADPKLNRTSVQINYAADDGYSSRCGYSSGKGVKLDGKPTEPQMALLCGVEELARLAALFGFESEARQAFEGAVARVNEWRSKRAS